MANNNTVDKPPTFTDDKQRTWTIKLNVQLLDDVQEATGIDLVPDKDNINSLTGLLFDHKKLSSVLWTLCSERAEAEKIDKRNFNQGLGPDGLANGWRAVVDSIIFFIHAQSPGKAKAIEEIIEAEMRTIELGTAQMLEALQATEVDEALKATAKRIGGEMKAEILSGLGKSATKSRG